MDLHVRPGRDRRASSARKKIMQTETESGVIISKTRELCQAILEQPEFQSMRQRVDAFLADESAKALYQTVSEQGEHLNHKQQQGVPLDGAEVQDFEEKREALLKHSVARGFLDAQEQMQQIQQSISQYVSKTFELGRLPAPEDFEGGSCGSGCGCH